MKAGYLSQYFNGVAAKTLSAVESDILTSHQHEFNGVEGLRKILGEPSGKVTYKAKFMYLTDCEDDPIIEDGFLTWYDARQKARLEKGVMRSEYRLYFPDNLILQSANAGDLFILAKKKDDTLLAIVAEKDTTIARQLSWLFGFSDVEHPGFSVREELETDQDRIEFASRLILETIGIVVQTAAENWLDDMLKKFNGAFPSTKIFSEYARSTLTDLDPKDNPDEVFLAWMEREEILFRTFEKYAIAEKLSKGFDNDVDSFLTFSLSVQNRRKSRAGYAPENHLETIFKEFGIRYDRTPITENTNKPDFIFPGIIEYRNPSFDSLNLTMLGVKSTCKDRWRQVLSEADRIKEKHLLTMEAAISKNQTNEMKSRNLQLVVPKKLHVTYSKDQQEWLMDVKSFTNLVLEKQIITGK